MRTRLALAAASLRLGLGLYLTGCDADNLDPGAGNGRGTGTRTLTVTGAVYASPRQTQARVGADFAVSFSVRVSLDREPVTTGSVTVTSATGKVPLTFRETATGPGWSGLATGYDEVYVLDVITNAEKVEGVRVDGPDIHAFSQPREGASLDTSAPLIIAWHRDQPADIAVLRPEPADEIAIEDSGSYTLPAGAFWSDNSSARLHTVRLVRTNQVVPEGATRDSSWSVTLENDVHVIEPPLPL